MTGNSTTLETTATTEALFQQAAGKQGEYSRPYHGTIVFETCGMNGLVEVVVLASRIGIECESLEAVNDRVVLRATDSRRRLERLVAVSHQSVGIRSAEFEGLFPVA